DPGAATVVELAPGDQRRGVDVILRRLRTVSIRGRIIKPDRTTSLLIGIGTSTEVENSSIQDFRGGTFELRGVTPGHYTLTATAVTLNGEYTARMPIDVGTRDIEGLELRPLPPSNVKGAVRIEGKADSMARVRVEASSTLRKFETATLPSPAGEFTLRDLAA